MSQKVSASASSSVINDYAEFSKQMMIEKRPVFTTDAEGLWEAYMNSIPDDYEQHFKVPVSDLPDVQQLEQQLSPAFYTACLHDFIRMRERWLQLLKTLHHD